jgi:hypothetical protein
LCGTEAERATADPLRERAARCGELRAKTRDRRRNARRCRTGQWFAARGEAGKVEGDANRAPVVDVLAKSDQPRAEFAG